MDITMADQSTSNITMDTMSSQFASNTHPPSPLQEAWKLFTPMRYARIQVLLEKLEQIKPDTARALRARPDFTVLQDQVQTLLSQGPHAYRLAHQIVFQKELIVRKALEEALSEQKHREERMSLIEGRTSKGKTWEQIAITSEEFDSSRQLDRPRGVHQAQNAQGMMEMEVDTSMEGEEDLGELAGRLKGFNLQDGCNEDLRDVKNSDMTMDS